MTLAVAQLQQIEHGDVAGVRTVWLPSDSDEVSASLVFRVGMWDETAPERGLTHLVEHLALARLAQRPHSYNGITQPLMTQFIIEGSQAEVAAYLEEVSNALCALPMDLLEREVRMLRTEATSRGMTVAAHALRIRYGPTGPGVTSLPELAIEHIRPQMVGQWAARFFHSGNAVLCLHGGTPESLRLHLPSGVGPILPPIPTPLLIKLPAFTPVDMNGVGVSLLGGEQRFVGATAELASMHLMRTLRHERGLSYSVSTNAERIDGLAVHAAIFADCLPETALAVRGALVEELDRFAERGPAAEDLLQLLAPMRRAVHDPAAAGVAWLSRAANDMLLGREPKTPEHYLLELEALTPEHFAASMRTLLSSVIVLYPDTLPEMDRGRFSPVRRQEQPPVTGQMVEPLPNAPLHRRARLVVSPEGITYVDPKNENTVRFATCAFVLYSAAGQFVLVGENDRRVGFDIADWPQGNALAELVCTSVPQDKLVPMDDQPRAARARTAAGGDADGLGAIGGPRLTVIAGMLGIFALIALALLIVSNVNFTGFPGSRSGGSMAIPIPIGLIVWFFIRSRR